MKKFIISFVLLLVASFAFQGCEKEKVIKEMNSDLSVSEIKKKPSITTLAAILGISVENIVYVEHKSGYYECHNLYYPNGQLQEHWYRCNPPKDAYCCSVVYVNTHAGAKKIITNGYLGIKYNNKNVPESLFIIFDIDVMQDVSWIRSSYLKIPSERPIANAYELKLCNDNQFVALPAGIYQLKQFETFKYFEINIKNLLIHDGNLVEE